MNVSDDVKKKCQNITRELNELETRLKEAAEKTASAKSGLERAEAKLAAQQRSGNLEPQAHVEAVAAAKRTVEVATISVTRASQEEDSVKVTFFNSVRGITGEVVDLLRSQADSETRRMASLIGSVLGAVADLNRAKIHDMISRTDSVRNPTAEAGRLQSSTLRLDGIPSIGNIRHALSILTA